MTLRSMYAERRRIPVLVLVLSTAVAVVAVLVGESAVAVSLAAALVLSSLLLVVIAGRPDLGEKPMRMTAAATAILGVLVLLVADDARAAVILLAFSLGFVTAVALLAVVLLLAGISDPPDWLRDADGRPAPAVRRLPLALRHAATLARQRPRRAPIRVVGRARRDMERMVWRPASAEATAFSHFLVVLHPRTIAKIDAWMPIQHVAGELAHSYADAHADLPGRSNLVVVHVASDTEVPVGAAAVAGSFREPRPQRPVAKAWARLHGVPDSHGLDGVYRYPIVAAPGIDSDATVVMAPEHDGATLVATALHAPALVLRRCGPDGAVLPTADELPLDGSGPWTIGRGPQADARFEQPHVSRVHAQLFELDGGWGIVDRSSRGTMLNGRPLQPGRPEPVRPGDVIELGRDATERVLLRLM